MAGATSARWHGVSMPSVMVMSNSVSALCPIPETWHGLPMPNLLHWDLLKDPFLHLCNDLIFGFP